MKQTATDTTFTDYNENARAFEDSTGDIELSAMRGCFTSPLEPGSRILDLGCRLNRKMRVFLEEDFDVTAIDRHAEPHRFAEEPAACSSILHLPKYQLACVPRRIGRTLRPRCIAYTSFRYGDIEEMRNGRHFTDFTEPTLRDLLSTADVSLIIEQLWTTSGVRYERSNGRRLTVSLRKA